LYYLYNNTSRNIPQDIFGKFDKKNKPIKAFGGFLFFISVKQPYFTKQEKIHNQNQVNKTLTFALFSAIIWITEYARYNLQGRVKFPTGGNAQWR